jgi:hypothetical protein
LKRKGILALALGLIAVLAMGAGVAGAATKYATKINFIGTAGPNNDLRLFGDLDTNRKCRGARELGLFKETSGGDFRLVDADLSSLNGAWAFRADLTGAPDIAIKVKKDTRNHGNVICKSKTLLLSANKAQYPG